MTGPNSRPTASVPRFWTANSPTRMTIAAGMTNGARPGFTVSRPSTAESTETAGVIIASPKKSAVAAIPSRTKPPVHLPPPSERWMSASSARLPPSPLLSARRMMPTYLTVTISISDQNMRLSTPKICSGSTLKGWCATKTSFIA